MSGPSSSSSASSSALSTETLDRVIENNDDVIATALDIIANPASHTTTAVRAANANLLESTTKRVSLLSLRASLVPTVVVPPAGAPIAPRLTRKIPHVNSFNPNTSSSPEAHLKVVAAVFASSHLDPTLWPLGLALSIKTETSLQWALAALTRKEPEKLADPDAEWEWVRAAFISHFAPKDFKERRLAELHRLKQQPKESVRTFGERVQQLFSDLSMTDDDERVFSILSEAILPCFRTSFQQLQLNGNDDVHRLHDALSKLATIESNQQPRQSTQPRGNSPPSSSSPASSSSTTSSSTSGSGLRCSYCKNKGHDIADCRKRANANGSSSRAPSGTSFRGSSSNASERRPLKEVQCYGCQQFGHYRSACPTRDAPPIVATVQPVVDEGSPLASSGSPSSDFAMSADDLDHPRVVDAPLEEHLSAFMSDEDLDCEVCCVATRPNCSHETLRSGDFAPVLVGRSQTRVMAMVDNGSGVSLLSPALIERTATPLNPTVSRQVQVAGGGLCTTRVAPGVEMRCGDVLAIHTFDVMELPTGVEAIIGRDLFPTFGITVQGIPVAYPGTTSPPQDDDDTIPTLRPAWHPDDQLGETQRIELLAAVEPLLAANEAIKAGTLCDFQEAEVHLFTGNHAPVFRRQYGIPQRHRAAVDKKITEWLLLGKISLAPPDSPWNCSLTTVPKKDPKTGEKTGVRVCIDPRPLNLLLEDESFALPLVNDIFDTLQGFVVASALDLAESFLQFPLHSPDRIKTTFTWRNVRYQFVGAPFGIKILPAHFQRAMVIILSDHLAYITIFVDDILIYSRSPAEHIRHVMAVLRTLNAVGLKLNTDKCHFGYVRVALLGHIISGLERNADPAKLSSVAGLERPTTGRQMQSVLGLLGYLREYVPLFSRLSAPLDALRHVNNITEEMWTADCDKAFVGLKSVLSSPPVLSSPDFKEPFLVGTDASQYAIGAVLYQETGGRRRYIAFASQSLNRAQRNYPATRRELLAIVFALRRFRMWLYGAHFTLFTDHRALTFLFTQRHEGAMLNYWAHVLLEFDFDCVHRPGIQMILEDALSRLYPPSFWEEEGLVPPVIDDSLKRVQRRKKKQAAPKQAVPQVMHAARRDEPSPSSPPIKMSLFFRDDLPSSADMEADSLPPIPDYCPTVADSLVAPIAVLDDSPDDSAALLKEFIRHRINKKEPADAAERKAILQRYHRISHVGAEGLFRQVWTAGFFWQDCRKECAALVAECVECLRHNVARVGFHPLATILASYPGDHVGIDLAGPFPPSLDGHVYLLLYVDVATRFVLLRALTDKRMETVAYSIFAIFCDFGVPKIIQSDNGKEFVNQVLAAMINICGIDHRTISSYNPRANGVSERYVGLAKVDLAKEIDGNYDHWNFVLPRVQLGLNRRLSRRHRSTPFALMFGRPANELADYRTTDAADFDETRWLQRFETMRNVVHDAILDRTRKYNEALVRSYGKRKNLVGKRGLPTGAIVMTKAPPRSGPTVPRFSGPFTVVRRNTGGAYLLMDSDLKAVARTFPLDQLKLVRYPDNAPVVPAGDIEVISKHRSDDHSTTFLVKWKESLKRKDSWLPEAFFASTTLASMYWNRRQTRARMTPEQPARSYRHPRRNHYVQPVPPLPRQDNSNNNLNSNNSRRSSRRRPRR